MTTDEHEVLSGRTLGEFFLLDRLDEGGAGAVYRARQDGLARPAVVKVLHQRAPSTDASLQRLLREAQLACRVDHIYAVHVYAFGVEDDGLLWIAMELVDGISLGDWLSEHGPMPIEVFVPFFERVAQVVQAAHKQGIVHRDLKPSNIMVIEQGGELLPKLLDFGLAKLVDDVTGQTRGRAVQPSSRPADNLTASDCMLGSASYMAPEAWLEPATVGRAADIYALGVIAFEALTGRRPYRGETFQHLGALHCHAPVPAGPATLRRALSKRPEDRHDSALDLAAALRFEAGADRRRARARRIGAVLGLVIASLIVGAVQFRALYLTRVAQQRADAAEITAELEQGRAALLHDDLAAAQRHLGAAWRGGDHARSTEFMLDRAQQPLRAELARLPAARGRMWSSSWSPDGALIATTDDAGAQIWDAATYQPLSPLPHEDVVYAAAWTPEGLITACGDGSVRIWDPARGLLVRELRLGGQHPRWYAVAAAAGRIAAVDAKGAIAAAWDAGTGVVLASLDLGGAGWPAVAFSADGRWLAATGGDAVQVVEVERRSVTSTFGEQVRAIAWNPAIPNLLVGTVAGDAMVWSALGRGPPTLAARLGESVTAVAFAPDGARAAIGGEDGTEQIVDTATGRIASQGNHLHAKIASLAFSADGARVVAAGVSGELAIGDVATGLPVEVLEGSAQQLRGAAFGPTGRRVLAASWDGTARIWDARSPYRQWSAARQSSGFGLFGGVEPDGRYMAIACPGCATRVWDTARDELLAELPEVAGSGGDAPVPFPAVYAVGDRAAIARGAAAEIYALPGGRLLRTVTHAAPVTALAFTLDGELVSGDAAGSVLVIHGKTDVVLVAPGGAGIAALAVLSDGRVATADTSGRVRVLDGAGAQTTAGARVRMLRPSPDGRRLLVVPFHAGPPAPMVLLDVDRGTVAMLDGPPVYTARWVDGGILSAHADGAARLWSADGALRHTYTGGARFLADADLTPDGSMVVGGGGDGMLRFWDTATAKPLWVAAAHRPYIMGVHFAGGDIVTRGVGGEVARWHIPASNDAKYAQTLPIH
jgi:WD40 repeat protein/tRNA A-37 threonylcarbamoyl transferase component Bud32